MLRLLFLFDLVDAIFFIKLYKRQFDFIKMKAAVSKLGIKF